jgi:excisionase family DNA binding protein
VSLNPVPRPDTELVTIDEMASRMAMTRTTFERLVRVHRIPKVRLGHKIVRFAPEAVIAYVTEKLTTT